MSWYNESGSMQDVVISTRVRFARNLEQYPFASRLTDKDAGEIIEKVKAALPEYRCEEFASGSSHRREAASYMEMHYVSPEFYESDRRRALLTGENGHVQIMVCEEDHLRIQSIVAGFEPEKAFGYAAAADDVLCDKLKIAYSEKYGYLTHCPTNLGAAMRVSAMLCLPALTLGNSIGKCAGAMGKMGITIRGLYGEGSKATGCLYQISNRASLGMGEEEIIKMISDVVKNLVDSERKARKSLYSLNRTRISDAIARRLGTLKSAYTLTSDEFTEAFSDLKLGCSLGLLTSLPDEKLSEMLIAVQPATISLSREGLDDENARDIARARLIRSFLSAVEFAY